MLWRSQLGKIWTAEDGQDLAEYALLLLLIVVVVLAAVIVLQTQLGNIWVAITTKLFP
jgi:Flp pilus assembly pilin Flp